MVPALHRVLVDGRAYQICAATVCRQVEALAAEIRAVVSAPPITANGHAQPSEPQPPTPLAEWAATLTCIGRDAQVPVFSVAEGSSPGACFDSSVPPWAMQALLSSVKRSDGDEQTLAGVDGGGWVRVANVMPTARITTVSARYDTSLWRALKNSRLMRSSTGQLRRARQV